MNKYVFHVLQMTSYSINLKTCSGYFLVLNLPRGTFNWLWNNLNEYWCLYMTQISKLDQKKEDWLFLYSIYSWCLPAGQNLQIRSTLYTPQTGRAYIYIFPGKWVYVAALMLKFCHAVIEILLFQPFGSDFSSFTCCYAPPPSSSVSTGLLTPTICVHNLLPVWQPHLASSVFCFSLI